MINGCKGGSNSMVITANYCTENLRGDIESEVYFTTISRRLLLFNCYFLNLFSTGNRFEQLTGIIVFWVVVNSCHFLQLDNPPRLHDGYPIADLADHG